VQVEGIRFPQPEIRMAFKIQSLSVDLVIGDRQFCGVQASTPSPKMVQGTFPFTPTGREGHEHDKVLAAAKAVLQQALNEL
jgi:hypothetical protein